MGFLYKLVLEIWFSKDGGVNYNLKIYEYVIEKETEKGYKINGLMIKKDQLNKINFGDGIVNNLAEIYVKEDKLSKVRKELLSSLIERTKKDISKLETVLSCLNTMTPKERFSSNKDLYE